MLKYLGLGRQTSQKVCVCDVNIEGIFIYAFMLRNVYVIQKHVKICRSTRLPKDTDHSHLCTLYLSLSPIYLSVWFSLSLSLVCTQTHTHTNLGMRPRPIVIASKGLFRILSSFEIIRSMGVRTSLVEGLQADGLALEA